MAVHNAFYGAVKGSHCFIVKLFDICLRMYLFLVKDLIGIYIAQAGNVGLIH